jgi:hypothetical protein
VQLDHRLDGREDIAKETTKFVEVAAEASGVTHLFVERVRGELAGLVGNEQLGLVDEPFNFIGGHATARGESARSDGVIKIDEDFSEVEDDGFGNHVSSRRPSRAMLTVKSSANSRPLPAGKP